jgi:hypothetical protein
MIYPDKYREEPTRRTPWISLEPGRIFIMGRSIPEDPGEFFRPVHGWISEYASSHAETTRIDIGFEYINTSSIKWIFNILKEISEMPDIKKKVKISWYYEEGDEDMSELGFILKSLIDCSFVLTEIDEMKRSRYEAILVGRAN